MTVSTEAIVHFLEGLHPYADLSAEVRKVVASGMGVKTVPAGGSIFFLDEELEGLFVVWSGEVEIVNEHGAPVSLLGRRNSFGERGLLEDGRALTEARAITETMLLVLPAPMFAQLIADHEPFRAFFSRTPRERPPQRTLANTRIEELMVRGPITCAPDDTVQEAARRMRKHGISSLCMTEHGKLTGIVTMRDLSGKVVAEGLSPATPVSDIVTRNPVTLEPSMLGSDVLHTMVERGIGHLPICEFGELVGIVTQTNLTRWQADSSADFVSAVASAPSVDQMAEIARKIPNLLVSLVAAGHRHEVTTRLITDIADAITRRLIRLAHHELGDAPAAYCWAACGSQGRQEQTGLSDQDNCLIIADDAGPEAMGWFEDFARFVCDGLNACGYFYCPGEMMATNSQWRQKVGVWRAYFDKWIARPDPMAQMLASVMFDLRPIGGDSALFDALQHDTLEAASKNSIFVKHMTANALKHQPPLGLFRGFATIRSGEHKNTLDLKHNGVVPVTDLARIYAIRGRLAPVNTRARLEAARAAKVVSQRDGQALLDAFDLIAQTRLEHQVRRVKGGESPDNFMEPWRLSDFERSHLRNAFVVIKGLQSAIGHRLGPLA
ncbi:nucleotidyltransferase/CBS/cyclic nucleotide-binding domain protein [Fulvimarina pelagi HTCC2506]|uniref:Nucleotidyltransferase/CBS/cyclic nucleotide-binding domain protein n=1 Tax=Fulvimarina pelagi HTCC2506 TaxID=314231 RepID=Q0FXM3_9HYPH|nr:DUF294 nucleotidyltransferase-like domain-containing protein [Fulvimarina pelagi]EAU39713.1 nucleotidyltransferase/CBS/cyclic nucleotide-binding domain protein [Fulvimarina pelagi HTCC2506]